MENLNLTEINHKELQEIEGGSFFVGLVIGFFVGLVLLSGKGDTGEV